MTIGRTEMFHNLNEFLKDTEEVRFNNSVKSKIVNNLQSFSGSTTSNMLKPQLYISYNAIDSGWDWENSHAAYI